MADQPTPEPLAPDQPPADPPPATSKQRPVVLATYPLEELHIPGEDGGDGIHVTSTGVALSKAQAKHVEDVAARSGVRLTDITPAEKD